ncbi:MAG: hypothetical protein FJ313_00690 [Gemmatimonadetes bacterium]|nr:hypothetical protein [Gemmatimonadota bacterium]
MSTNVLSVDEVRRKLTDAQDRLREAEGAVGKAQADYQQALTAEATGAAKSGSAAKAKQALADAEHKRDIAQAGLKAAQEALAEAERAADERRLAEIGAEIGKLDEEFEHLGRELTDALEQLASIWHSFEATNAQGVELRSEGGTIAGRRGVAPPHFSRRGVTLSEPMLRVLDALGQRRTSMRASPAVKLVA